MYRSKHQPAYAALTFLRSMIKYGMLPRSIEPQAQRIVDEADAEAANEELLEQGAHSHNEEVAR